jgi:hypothetical protein
VWERASGEKSIDPSDKREPPEIEHYETIVIINSNKKAGSKKKRSKSFVKSPSRDITPASRDT